MHGGGFYNYGPGTPCEDSERLLAGKPKFINCLFWLNQAEVDENGKGGAMYCEPFASLNLINCTVADNAASTTAGGIYHANQSTCSPQFGGHADLHGCIVYDNTNGQISPTTGTIEYSDVEGFSTSGTNIGDDPLFVGSGDYHLQCGSPCIDKVGSSIDPDDSDVDQDDDTTEATPDLDDHYRIIDSLPDMGAYEKPLAGFCTGDIAPLPCGNGIINVDDLLEVINHWGTCTDPENCPGDIVVTGTVNVDDLLAVINNWGACPGFTSDESSMPTSIQDCEDDASEEYEAFTPDWYDYVNKCVQALCEAHIINCDE